MSENEKKELIDDDSDDIVVPRRSGFRFRNRSPIFLLFMVAASFYLMYAQMDDLLYFFTSATPVQLGDAEEFKGTDLPESTYVSINGLQNPIKGIGLSGTFSKTSVFPLMGTPLVYVQTRQEKDKEAKGLSYGTFTGRLYYMSRLPYFETIKKFAFQSFGIEVNPAAIMVYDGRKPGDNWYYLPIYALLLVVAALNLTLLIKRLTRR